MLDGAMREGREKWMHGQPYIWGDCAPAIGAGVEKPPLRRAATGSQIPLPHDPPTRAKFPSFFSFI
jgi:hypothetical protein